MFFSTRRGFMSLCLASFIGFQKSYAMGTVSNVGIGLISRSSMNSNTRKQALMSLLFELSRNTSTEINKVIDVKLIEKDLFRQPILCWSNYSQENALSFSECQALRTYLKNGGFLWLDDSSGLENSSFDLSIRKNMQLVFPDSQFSKISETHAIYRSFFLLPKISGRVSITDFAEGISIEPNITSVIYTRNDVIGAFAKDALGSYVYECIPEGEKQRDLAYKLGLNIMMYALCLNYKLDLTHVQALLKKRRGVFDQ